MAEVLPKIKVSSPSPPVTVIDVAAPPRLINPRLSVPDEILELDAVPAILKVSEPVPPVRVELTNAPFMKMESLPAPTLIDVLVAPRPPKLSESLPLPAVNVAVEKIPALVVPIKRLLPSPKARLLLEKLDNVNVSLPAPAINVLRAIAPVVELSVKRLLSAPRSRYKLETVLEIAILKESAPAPPNMVEALKLEVVK